MGVDLVLMPLEGCDGCRFCHTLLDCERRHELWSAIEVATNGKLRDVPDHLDTYMARTAEGDRCYGKTTHDNYGQTLKMVHAVVLAGMIHEGIDDNHTNRAVWAYLRALPPDQFVVLYW